METIELDYNQHETEEDEGGYTEPLAETANESKKSKQNKGYELADVRLFTERNAKIDYKILLALYEHRALTPAQLKKGWFPELHENSIRNRTKTLAERKILTVNVKPGVKMHPIKMYSLSTFGLRIVTENILQVMEYLPHFDERKEHYTIDDLKVRNQHIHHYELQEWVIDILSKRPGVFHCEWRRFPFVEEQEEAVRVRPDWIFLEADEETTLMTKEEEANNPLLYPYFYRKDIFSDVTFTPFLCVECDRGTMSRSELIEKWSGYRSLSAAYKPQAISMFYTQQKSNGDMRHRLIRDTMGHAFELEVVQNEIDLFEGDYAVTQSVVSLFLERDKVLLKGEEMTNEKELIPYIEAYSKTLENGEYSVLDEEKAVQTFKLPVRPDAMILKEQGSISLHLVFYAIAGWVNPIIKIQAIKRWIKEGHLSQFSEIRFILLYPDKSFLEDIQTMEKDIYYVSYQEVKELGSWGKAHQEQRKNRKVKWQEVTL